MNKQFTLKDHNDTSFESIIGFVFQGGITTDILIVFDAVSHQKWKFGLTLHKFAGIFHLYWWYLNTIQKGNNL